MSLQKLTMWLFFKIKNLNFAPQFLISPNLSMTICGVPLEDCLLSYFGVWYAPRGEWGRNYWKPHFGSALTIHGAHLQFHLRRWEGQRQAARKSHSHTWRQRQKLEWYVHKPRHIKDAGQHQKLENTRKVYSFRSLEGRFRTSNLFQNCEIIHSYCFKAPSLW